MISLFCFVPLHAMCADDILQDDCELDLPAFLQI
jgi:hypothetical protein